MLLVIYNFALFRKEVLVIAITSAVFLNLLSNKIRGRAPPREVIHRVYFFYKFCFLNHNLLLFLCFFL